MNQWTLAFWIAALVAVYASLALAVLAARSERHWLVVPSVVPIAGAIIFGLVGMPPAPHPLVALAAGAGYLLLGVIGGSPVVSLVLELATPGSVRLGTHGGILVAASSKEGATVASPAREVLRGGSTIGYVERLALIGAALVGQFAAVAVIVAVKGLGRFSELENAAARERFIIGTLVSLVWASACATAIMIAR